MARVVIAPAARSDAAELIQGHIDSRAFHQPWASPFTDQAGFDAWFAQFSTEANAGLVARDAETGGVVGVVNFSQIFRGGFQNAYLGYHGMMVCAGRGLMTEAVGIAVRYGFGELGLHRLEANIQPGNLASIALVRRIGFRKEGFSPQYLHIGGAWRDHERWALLQDDLTPRPDA